MHANWHLSYEQWKEGILDWCDTIENNFLNRLKISNFRVLAMVALVERLLGAALADIAVTDQMSREEQEGRLNLICQTINDFIIMYWRL